MNKGEKKTATYKETQKNPIDINKFFKGNFNNSKWAITWTTLIKEIYSKINPKQQFFAPTNRIIY